MRGIRLLFGMILFLKLFQGSSLKLCTLYTLNFENLQGQRRKWNIASERVSGIFRGENTISRRTLTPNTIGCFSETWKGFNQWEGLCVVASIPLRTYSFFRGCQRGKVGCLDSTRAGWQRVKRLNRPSTKTNLFLIDQKQILDVLSFFGHQH